MGEVGGSTITLMEFFSATEEDGSRSWLIACLECSDSVMSVLLESQSHKFFSILASIPGKKSLILDQSLSILISSLATFTQLQDHGVESVKWLLTTDVVDSPPERVLFISRPEVDSVRKVASIVKATKGKDFTLLLVPRRTIQAEEILEKEGVFADIDVKVLAIKISQEAPDLIRVDVPSNPFSSPLVSPKEIFTVAQSLTDLQRQFGQCSRVRGKGPNVVTLTSVLQQLEADLTITEETSLETGLIFGECIVLDRATDLITPLLTQLTYEGLLYELYLISGSILELPAQITSTERKITLGESDSIFTDIRGENFANVGPKLSSTASGLSSELDSRHGLKTTTQLKQFVSRIPNLQSSQKLLKVHIELTEQLLVRTNAFEFRQVLELQQSLYSGFPESDLLEPLESLIAIQTPLPTILRILCLWSTIHNGLKSKDHEALTTRVVQAYGTESLLAIHRLSSAGLFIVRTPQTERGRGGWNGFSRAWNLVPPEDAEGDIAYLYSGYAPLNLRILEGYLDPDRFGVSESAALKVLGSSSSNASRNIDAMMKNLRGANVDVLKDRQAKQTLETVTCIVFLGGCCATELAGVRFVMQKLGRQYVVVTKGMIEGNGMMQSFLTH